MTFCLPGDRLRPRSRNRSRGTGVVDSNSAAHVSTRLKTGVTPGGPRRARVGQGARPRGARGRGRRSRCAWRGGGVRRPRAPVPPAALTSRSTAITSWNRSRNQGSMPVISATACDGRPGAKCLEDGEDPLGPRHAQRVGLRRHGRREERLDPARAPRLQGAHRLAERLGERAAERHHLAHGLHLDAELVSAPGNFSKAKRGIFTTT